MVMSQVNQNYAGDGGAFGLFGVSLWLTLTNVGSDNATDDGGAFLVNGAMVTSDCNSDMRKNWAGNTGGIVSCVSNSDVDLGDSSCANIFQAQPNLAYCAPESECVVTIAGANAC